MVVLSLWNTPLATIGNHVFGSEYLLSALLILDREDHVQGTINNYFYP